MVGGPAQASAESQVGSSAEGAPEEKEDDKGEEKEDDEGAPEEDDMIAASLRNRAWRRQVGGRTFHRQQGTRAILCDS